MDLIGLIAKSPALYDQLKDLGLDGDAIVGVGGELNRQLRATEGPDLTDCLKGLDVQGCDEMLDVNELATRVGIDSALAGEAVKLVAPVIQAFDGDLGSVARSLAGGLFGNRD